MPPPAPRRRDDEPGALLGHRLHQEAPHRVDAQLPVGPAVDAAVAALWVSDPVAAARPGRLLASGDSSRDCVATTARSAPPRRPRSLGHSSAAAPAGDARIPGVDLPGAHAASRE